MILRQVYLNIPTNYTRQPCSIEQQNWSGLYTGDVNLSPDVMNGLMDNLN